MKKIVLVCFSLISTIVFAQIDSIQSKMYSWKKPVHEIHENIFSSAIFEGTTRDMSFLQMTVNTILPSKKKTDLRVPNNEEHLLLIRKGILTIGMKDSSWSIGTGSVVLLMPGQKYSMQNGNEDSCHFYLMKYRAKLPMDLARGKKSGNSSVKNWNKIDFKPHDKGGTRNFFERPTAMCQRFEMHCTTLNEGIKSHEPHTHRAEEIVLVISNKTEMQIANQFYKGGTGDVYYLGSNISHAIRNDGKGTCIYFAFQFE